MREFPADPRRGIDSFHQHDHDRGPPSRRPADLRRSTSGPRPGARESRSGIGGSSRSNPRGPRFGSPPDPRDLPEGAVTETGTTVIGLRTAEGVVMAADRRASIGGRFVTDKRARKLHQVHPTATLAISGSVSAAQSLVRNLRSETTLYETRRDERMSLHALSTLTSNLLGSGAFYIVQPILGGVDDEGGHVYDFDAAGGMATADYAAKGSGMQLAYGHLEAGYEEGLSNDAATGVATRAIESAVERDTASGNGLLLADITAEGVETETYDDFEAALD